MAAWTPSERERRDTVKAGGTVLANIKTDVHLVEWAQKNGFYVFVGRPSDWRNPYVIGEDGDRATCIKSFALYFSRKYGLHKRLAELRGKVLGCYCYPEPCHGGVLLKRLEEGET